MRRCFMVRAATLLLVSLLSLATLRAAAPSCCGDEDCAASCCDRDLAHSTVRPLLPCCRTFGIERASAHRLPTTVDAADAAMDAPPAAVTPSPVVAVRAPGLERGCSHVPAPPLYHQHCALLL